MSQTTIFLFLFLPCLVWYRFVLYCVVLSYSVLPCLSLSCRSCLISSYFCLLSYVLSCRVLFRQRILACVVSSIALGHTSLMAIGVCCFVSCVVLSCLVVLSCVLLSCLVFLWSFLVLCCVVSPCLVFSSPSCLVVSFMFAFAVRAGCCFSLSLRLSLSFLVLFCHVFFVCFFLFLRLSLSLSYSCLAFLYLSLLLCLPPVSHLVWSTWQILYSGNLSHPTSSSLHLHFCQPPCSRQVYESSSFSLSFFFPLHLSLLSLSRLHFIWHKVTSHHYLVQTKTKWIIERAPWSSKVRIQVFVQTNKSGLFLTRFHFDAIAHGSTPCTKFLASCQPLFFQLGQAQWAKARTSCLLTKCAELA